MAQLSPINALGTQFRIEIWDAVPQTTLDLVFDQVQCLLSEFEKNFSRFKPDSYISTLNRERVVYNPPAEFISLLEQGLTYYDLTDGLINMMVGETLVTTGYDATYTFQATNPPATVPNPHEVISITNSCITVTSGLIDIGGFGKGIAIDRVANLLQTEFKLNYFLINGGGDMYGTSDNGQPITLYLEHPTQANTYLGTTEILNQGFAASSPHKRAWVHNNTQYHHIVDTSNSEVSSIKPDASFVIADTAVTADVFATVALVATTDQMTTYQIREQLAIATFTLPNSLKRNQAFPVQELN